jgi:glycosyltransferase involved in cell wall biosynthesis
MSKTPNISVVMPVYNDARYLPRAIESILDQTLEAFEYIIVDDHSMDETRDIIARYARLDSRIRVIRNEKNLGVARSLNRGYKVASGELIARMDSDDISLPERFEKQVAFLEAHPRVGVLGTQTVFIEEDDRFSQQPEWEKPTSHNDLVWRLLYSTPICHPSVMMRMKCFKEVGGYNQDYPNEDMKLWTEMAFFTKLANLEDVLLHYRMPLQRHTQKLAYWEPHIQRVSREYAEKLVDHEIDPKLIQVFFDFQLHNEAIKKDVALDEAIKVCQMLEDIFQAMKKKGVLEPQDIESVETYLFRQIQCLVSPAFQ